MHVFISHPSEDSVVTSSIKRSLEKRGIKHYAFEDHPELGEPLLQKIHNAIDKSNALIAIYLKNYPSPSVDQEVGYAMKQKIPIIPMIEKGCRIGFMINSVEQQIFDMGDIVQACERVATYVEKKIKHETRSSYKGTLVDERKVIDANDYEVYSYGLPKGAIITGNIFSNMPINVYIMDALNFNRFEKERSFTYEGTERVTRYKVDFIVPEKRDWFIVIEHAEDDVDDYVAEVDVKLNVS